MCFMSKINTYFMNNLTSIFPFQAQSFKAATIAIITIQDRFIEIELMWAVCKRWDGGESQPNSSVVRKYQENFR